MMGTELPGLRSRQPNRRQSAPFENVMKSLDLSDGRKRSTHYRTRKLSQDIYVPADLKSYTDGNLQELSVRTKGKEEEYQNRYMRILKRDSHAFYKLTGEFTFFSDCSVRINRAGPYNKLKG
jgi:hypothetical protein